MDPVYINSDLWGSTGNILTYIWILFFSAVGFGFNFLMAHAIIPSLIGSGHLPARLQKARPLFYGGAAFALALVIFALNRAAANAGFLEDIYPRWWI